MIRDFFTYPMRIFFLISCFIVIVGACSFFGKFDYIFLHKFMFLRILPLCAYSGFLLTALPDWLNYEKSLIKIAVLIFFMLIVSFALGILGQIYAFLAIAIFWFFLSIFSAYLMIRVRNFDHISIVYTLFAFGIVEIYYFFSHDENANLTLLHLNIIAILIIGFRVSAAIANEAIKDIKDALFVPNFIHKNLAIFFILLYILAINLIKNDLVLGFMALGISCVIFAKLKELFYFVLLRKFYIFMYFLISFFIAFGYFCIGICKILAIGFESALTHILTICAFLGIILFVFNVAGLRHSGQNLAFSKLSKFSFSLIFLSGLIRAFLWDKSVIFYQYLPAIFVIFAFVLYFKEFFVIFKNNEFTPDPE